MCFNFFLERKKKRIPGQRKCLVDNLNGTNELFNKIFNFFFFLGQKDRRKASAPRTTEVTM